MSQRPAISGPRCQADPSGQEHGGPIGQYVRLCPAGHIRRGQSCRDCAGRGAVLCIECQPAGPAILLCETTFDALVADERTEPITEYAVQMSGGGMHVRNGAPHIERIYPLAVWIQGQRQHDGKVYRRRVLVVEDWIEVTGP